MLISSESASSLLSQLVRGGTALTRPENFLLLLCCFVPSSSSSLLSAGLLVPSTLLFTNLLDFLTRAVEPESLKVWKSLKVGKSRIKSEKSDLIFYQTFGKKKYLINGDVLNAESEGSAQSHNNCSQTNYNFKMLITPERKVPQRSDTSQNDHKSKGYPSKTSAAAFTMQKSDRGAYRRLGHQTFY